MTENNSLNYYRLKTEWTSDVYGGNLKKIKTEELVLATSYTEAEQVAYEIAEQQARCKFGDINIEITKTKINDILLNDTLCQDERLVCGMVENYFAESEDTGVGLYVVKVQFVTLDEKNGTEKYTNETMYIPARSNIDATERASSYIDTNMPGAVYIIRDTKFDKAEAIFWPRDVAANKLSNNKTN